MTPSRSASSSLAKCHSEPPLAASAHCQHEYSSPASGCPLRPVTHQLPCLTRAGQTPLVNMLPTRMRQWLAGAPAQSPDSRPVLGGGRLQPSTQVLVEESGAVRRKEQGTVGGRTQQGASEVHREMGRGCKRDRLPCRVTQVPRATAPATPMGVSSKAVVSDSHSRYPRGDRVGHHWDTQHILALTLARPELPLWYFVQGRPLFTASLAPVNRPSLLSLLWKVLHKVLLVDSKPESRGKVSSSLQPAQYPWQPVQVTRQGLHRTQQAPLLGVSVMESRRRPRDKPGHMCLPRLPER